MEKEFKLSEKKDFFENGEYKEKDIKKFIRLLKEFHYKNGDVYGAKRFIDELAGEGLI